jgi:hypothetical protein
LFAQLTRRRIEHVNELYSRISALIDERAGDLVHIERTLTDGYAEALSLEAERWRLEKRLAEVAHALPNGDVTAKAHELAALAERLDGNAGELTRLRGALGDLRRHADAVRN